MYPSSVSSTLLINRAYSDRVLWNSLVVVPNGCALGHALADPRLRQLNTICWYLGAFSTETVRDADDESGKRRI